MTGSFRPEERRIGRSVEAEAERRHIHTGASPPRELAPAPYQPSLLGDEITRQDMIGEIRRELGQRARVYPRLILQGDLRQEQADRRCAILVAILKTLEEKS